MKKTKKEFRKNKKQRNLFSKFNLIFKKSPILILVLAGAMSFLLILAVVLAAGHSTTMNLQGKAFDSNGDPVDNEDLEVNISSASNCNGDVYSNTFTAAIQGGLFNVNLGESAPTLDLEYNKDYYLCLTVNPAGGGLAIGPTVFRGGQGQITEEDVSFDDISIGTITPSTTAKTLGSLASQWLTLFVKDVNSSRNVEIGEDLYFPAGSGSSTVYIDADVEKPFLSVRSRGAGSTRSALFTWAINNNQDAQIGALASNGSNGFIGGWSASKSMAYMSSGYGADLYFGMGKATENLIPMNGSVQNLGNSSNPWKQTYANFTRLMPTDAPLTCNSGNEGVVYYDDSLNELCMCTGTAPWQQIDGGGSCE